MKKIWNDPVLSKVIAFIICAILSLGYTTVTTLLNGQSFKDNFLQLLDFQIKFKYLFLATVVLFLLWLVLRKKKTVLTFTYTDEHKELDRKLLQKIKDELIPSTGSISFIRTNNFAGFSFRNDNLKDLYTFSHNFELPEFEFIDADLNHYLESLKIQTSVFLNTIGLNTWTLNNPNIDASTVPPEWELEQPDRFREVVDKIHSTAGQICKDYDELVKLGKRKLSI